jgi:hypothetical protein
MIKHWEAKYGLCWIFFPLSFPGQRNYWSHDDDDDNKSHMLFFSIFSRLYWILFWWVNLQINQSISEAPRYLYKSSTTVFGLSLEYGELIPQWLPWKKNRDRHLEDRKRRSEKEREKGRASVRIRMLICILPLVFRSDGVIDAVVISIVILAILIVYSRGHCKVQTRRNVRRHLENYNLLHFVLVNTTQTVVTMSVANSDNTCASCMWPCPPCHKQQNNENSTTPNAFAWV